MATLKTKQAIRRALKEVYRISKNVRTANYDASENNRKKALLYAMIELECLPNLLEYISDRMKGGQYD